MRCFADVEKQQLLRYLYCCNYIFKPLNEIFIREGNERNFIPHLFSHGETRYFIYTETSRIHVERTYLLIKFLLYTRVDIICARSEIAFLYILAFCCINSPRASPVGSARFRRRLKSAFYRKKKKKIVFIPEARFSVALGKMRNGIIAREEHSLE